MTYQVVLNVLIVLGIIVQMTNFWMSTHKKHTAHCVLTIFVAILFGSAEILMARHDPQQQILYFSSILYVWMLWQGVSGLRRQ